MRVVDPEGAVGWADGVAEGSVLTREQAPTGRATTGLQPSTSPASNSRAAPVGDGDARWGDRPPGPEGVGFDPELTEAERLTAAQREKRRERERAESARVLNVLKAPVVFHDDGAPAPQ